VGLDYRTLYEFQNTIPAIIDPSRIWFRLERYQYFPNKLTCEINIIINVEFTIAIPDNFICESHYTYRETIGEVAFNYE